MIRAAKPADLQQMVELGFRLCDQTPYARIPRDRPNIVNTFTMAMSSRFACAFVAEHEGRLTGLLVGISEELWYSRMRYAIDLVTYAERPWAGVLLLKRFKEWGWSVPKVVEVTASQSSGLNPERSAVIYRRAGFEPVGGVFTAVKPAFAAEVVAA